MTGNLHPLKIRRALNHGYSRQWAVPVPFGPDGWLYRLPQIDETDRSHRTLIVTCAPHYDPEPPNTLREWVHASLAGPVDPSYRELTIVKSAVFRDGHAYMVMVPVAEHVNISEHALHLYGRLDGSPALPTFAGELNGVRSI